MDIAERLNRQARLLFILNGLGFFAWQAGDGLARAGFATSTLAGAGLVAGGIGFGLWLVTLILVVGITWRARRAGVFDIMGDEWAKRARAKAAETGFWVATIAIVLAMTASNFGVDAQFMLKVLTGLAVASFLITYAVFDAQHDAIGEDA